MQVIRTYGARLSWRDSSNIGAIWYSRFYSRISQSLGIEEEDDKSAARILSRFVLEKSSLNHDSISPLILGKNVIVFGAGPSLEEDISGLGSFLTSGKIVVIAADGAADALKAHSVDPEIVVSDLDSCSVEELVNASNNRLLIIHAHGDNVELMRQLMPKLGKRILGTTQIEPFDEVHNYGGFTDGDRACYIAASFMPRSIALAGMDFGDIEGPFSKSMHSVSSDRKLRKLKLLFGKESLEFLIENSKGGKFSNLTRFGVEIKGAPRVSYEDFAREIS